MVADSAVHCRLDPPDYAIHLGAQTDVPWPVRYVAWPDFRLPTDPTDLREALSEALLRAESTRVEIACGGGRGRTGTALACLAILDGLPAADAVGYVRRHYHRHAVETPGQARFVRRFT